MSKLELRNSNFNTFGYTPGSHYKCPKIQGGGEKVNFFSFLFFYYFCLFLYFETQEKMKKVAHRGDMRMRSRGWWDEWRGRTVGVPTNVFRHTRQTFHANESKERAKNP